jgi:hypothetical protein
MARVGASVGSAGGGGSGQAGAAGISVSMASSMGCPQVGQKTAVSSTSVPQFGQ